MSVWLYVPKPFVGEMTQHGEAFIIRLRVASTFVLSFQVLAQCFELASLPCDHCFRRTSSVLKQPPQYEHLTAFVQMVLFYNRLPNALALGGLGHLKRTPVLT